MLGSELFGVVLIEGERAQRDVLAPVGNWMASVSHNGGW